jgi:hypothetical protein
LDLATEVLNKPSSIKDSYRVDYFLYIFKDPPFVSRLIIWNGLYGTFNLPRPMSPKISQIRAKSCLIEELIEKGFFNIEEINQLRDKGLIE